MADVADQVGLPPDARVHREQFVAYVIARAKRWHREHMGRLYADWGLWNDEHFAGSLVAPYLLLTVPGNSRAYGDYSRVSCFGGYGQTRIRPTLFTGEHPHLRAGPEFAEGRARFTSDVFLHETIHQFAHEILDDLEPGYKGHGPRFAAKCNAVGEDLGLPPVRPAKARGKDRALPSCAQWPHNVRPEGYYLGAYVGPDAGHTEPDRERQAGPGEDDGPDALERLVQAALAFGEALPPHLLRAVGELHRRGGLGAAPGLETLVRLAQLAAAVYLDATAGRGSDPTAERHPDHQRVIVSADGDTWGRLLEWAAGGQRKERNGD
jgi:hypothetical protein